MKKYMKNYADDFKVIIIFLIITAVVLIFLYLGIGRRIKSEILEESDTWFFASVAGLILVLLVGRIENKLIKKTLDAIL